VTKKAELQERNFDSEIIILLSLMRRLKIVADGHIAIKRYRKLARAPESKKRATFYIDSKKNIDRDISLCPICLHAMVVENYDWEIPEDFWYRTGRPWADDNPVYMRVNKNDWRVLSYREAKFIAECCKRDNIFYRIYCANSDAGMPKRENW
jgi:hypothetical protein